MAAVTRPAGTEILLVISMGISMGIYTLPPLSPTPRPRPPVARMRRPALPSRAPLSHVPAAQVQLTPLHLPGHCRPPRASGSRRPASQLRWGSRAYSAHSGKSVPWQIYCIKAYQEDF